MAVVYHNPVLLREVLQSISRSTPAVFCDATLGDGGYAQAVLDHAPKGSRLYGIDRDDQALARAAARLANYGEAFVPVKGNFRDIKALLAAHGVRSVDAVVCDLGISTLQISAPERGFMFSASGPLDMRMSPNVGRSAAEVIRTASEQELADIMYHYGEERQARRIAAALVKERDKRALTATDDLAQIVRRVVGGKFVVKSLARVFQSFRIYVNDELESLREFLPQALDLLTVGGRLAVVEYHSLESRIVKEFMQHESNPCTCPRDLPRCVCGRKPRLRIVHRQIKPSADEIRRNPSARSARLRVVEKIGEQA